MKRTILAATAIAFAASPAFAQEPASPAPSQQQPYAAWPHLSGPSVPHERASARPLPAERYGYVTEPAAPGRGGPYAAEPNLSPPSVPHEFTDAMPVAPAQGPYRGDPTAAPNQRGPYAAWPNLSYPSIPGSHYVQYGPYARY